MTDPDPDIRKIKDDIRQLEELKSRGGIPSALADASIAALKEKLAAYQAKLEGDGAIAQGADSQAVGKQGIAVRDVSESFLNTGTLNLFFSRYEVPSGKPKLSKDDFERILREYLSWVIKAYGKARLYGLESTRTAREQPRRQLSDVFVPLTLRRYSPPRRDEIEALAKEFKGDPMAHQRAYLRAVDGRREEGVEIDLGKLLTIQDRLAVIGGAGSGKSTLAAYLAASLAEAALHDEAPPFELPDGRKQLLPLIIPLRYYREYQRICADAHREQLRNPRTGRLAGFIPWYLHRRSPALELSEDFFDRLLLGGSCLLILDGLDEVVNRVERGQVKEQVENLANDIYPGNLVLVTARESGYRDVAVFGDDFVRLDVQPLLNEQIEMLVRNWCRVLYPEAMETQARDIIQSIQEINSRYEKQSLPRLVSTPLMVTMVVSVKWGENELPRERAELYEAAVKVILQAQYLESDEAQQELVSWGGQWDEQRNWLSHLAFEMHRGGRNGAAVPEERVREILINHPGMTEEKLDDFIQAVRLRGGLLEERAELFQFVHLTFQEFLAARLLAKDREKSLPQLHDRIEDPWWREVNLLVYGFAKTDYEPFAIQYLDWLGRLAPDEKHLAGLELAGAAVLEIERPDADQRQTQTYRLLQVFQDAALKTSSVMRARAGTTLASLGDPRFDPEHWYLPAAPQFGFIPIPSGKFLMGSDPTKDEQADEYEQPQHELDIPYDFYMARYPVTVAQYQLFVKDSGYKTSYEDSLDGVLNHPVVNVNWYDCLEYCKWLDGKLKVMSIQKAKEVQGKEQLAFWQGLAENRLHVILPSEAEWEKAARGTDRRIYPWGNEFDSNKANMDETGIDTTSAVGCFPSGTSPYGMLDMSGNVFEWTRSIFGEWDNKELHHKNVYRYPYKNDDGREDLTAADNFSRSLRGGSFDVSSRFVRCAFRFYANPYFGYFDIGFRVVVSPLLLS